LVLNAPSNNRLLCSLRAKDLAIFDQAQLRRTITDAGTAFVGRNAIS
jgi:hypothetical protein